MITTFNEFVNFTSVTELVLNAFNGSTLSHIILPTNISTIRNNVFWGTRLTDITLPSSVTSIEAGSFRSCSSLVSVTVLRSTPPTLGYAVFLGDTALTNIYVPAESVDAYKSANNWSTWANKITAIP